MRERFGSRLSDVDERIEEALGNKACSKYTDQQAYVRGWLRRDEERLQAGRSIQQTSSASPKTGPRLHRTEAEQEAFDAEAIRLYSRRGKDAKGV